MAAEKKEDIEALVNAAEETRGEFEDGFSVTRLSARDSVRFLEILEMDAEAPPAIIEAKEAHQRLIVRREP